MNRRIILGIIIVICIIVGVFVIYQTQYAPPTSTVEVTCLLHEETCLKLPIMTGTNLTDQTDQFPNKFTQPYQLIVMAFEREQQPNMIHFVPLFQEIAASRPDFDYYSLITMGDVPLPIRPFISGGLSSIVTESAIQEATYLFFLSDTDALLQALHIPDTEVLRIYILNQSGDVLWEGSGNFTPELEATIRQTVDALPIIE
jgi:hypothetical protein